MKLTHEACLMANGMLLHATNIRPVMRLVSDHLDPMRLLDERLRTVRSEASESEGPIVELDSAERRLVELATWALVEWLPETHSVIYTGYDFWELEAFLAELRKAE